MKIWFGTEESFVDHCRKYEAIEAKMGPIELLRHIIAKPQMSSTADKVRLEMDAEDYPNPVEYVLQGNVAVLSVNGGTQAKTSWITRYLSIPTYEDIRDRMIEASEDKNVASVMLHLNTPGGDASGAFALAEFIGAFNANAKPVVSYSDSHVASAGILYGTAAGALMLDKYGMAGSIGAVTHFRDMSGYYKAMGLNDVIVRSGEFKAVPNPLEPMNEQGMSVLQQSIDMWHNRFLDQLNINLDIPRDTIQKKMGNGKMFTAQDAVSMELAQGIATYDKMLASMQKTYQNVNQSPARSH